MSDDFGLEVLADMPNYYDWIMETFAPFVRGHVIEYGAGLGIISQRLEPLAEKLSLVEPSAVFVQALRGKFRDETKIELISESLEDHTRTIGPATSDTVVMVNVLEHIEDDRAAISALFRALRPGGHLLVFVPALQLLMSKLDVQFGHFRRYNRAELTAKVGQAGGKVIICRYFDFFGMLPWFVLNKLLGATNFNPKFIHVHDKFVVPISRRMERAISPPLGKNLIMIARKT
jgi:SAM-dependent methyltransferase